jgi:hypothetical protein
MEEIVSRFNCCDKRFYPYIEKVLNQMPDEVRAEITGNQSLQIICGEAFHSANSLHFSFDKPASHLIYLNNSLLKQRVFDIIYTIAHEIALYVAKEDDIIEGSSDKKAKELLVEWKFIMDIERIRPDEPMQESEGFKIGYEWAKRQKQSDLIWNYKEYFDEWNEERISPERFEQLYIDLAPFTILEQFRADKKDEEINTHKELLESGIIWGVMAKIKESIHEVG